MIRSNSEAQLSPATDTICLPVPVAKRLQTNSQLYKYTDSLLQISERQVLELKVQRDLLEERDVETRNNYDRQIGNLNNQIAIYIEQVKGFEKLLKREKRKRFWTGAAGVVATGAAIFLAVGK